MSPIAFQPAMFKDALVVLGAAAIVVPIFHRLKAPTLLGFILVGVLAGPYALGALAKAYPLLDWVTISDAEAIAPVAELGVVLLLFMIGLELSLERLKVMRRLVFGLGPLQVALSAAAIAGLCTAAGLDWKASWALGLALALSSTAIVLQTIASAKKMNSPTGRASFATLLFQDLAVAPILFLIGALGRRAEGDMWALARAGLEAGLVLVAIVAAGRLLLRPLFRQVARTNSPDLFMAACLLVIVGAGIAAQASGLSMALGALIAGALLAETEYHRQIEVMIEPFKGLFVGVFLIAVGMGINLGLLLDKPQIALGALAALIAVKAGLAFGLNRMFGFGRAASLRSALLISAGGEFSFVALGAAFAAGVLDQDTASLALLVCALSMSLIPLLWIAGRRAEQILKPALKDSGATQPQPTTPAGDMPHVILLGFGRVGEVVARLFEQHKIPYLALDSNPDVVAVARKRGKPVYFGQAAQPDILRACGIEAARALVVTMDSPREAEAIVAAARGLREDLPIVARARDSAHAARLYQAGATDAAPETVEASLQLGEAALVSVGVPMGHAIASIHEERAAARRDIQKMAPDATQPSRPRRRLRDLLKGGEGSGE